MQQLQNKKILITGGNGFLGKHLFSMLRQITRQVSLYEGDIRGISSFRKHYDIVYHLAAINKIDSAGDASLLFESNVIGTLAVMSYCLRADAKCVFASSSAVYKPDTQNRKLSEHSCVRPVSLYGATKMLAEYICKYYAENFGISIAALRIFNIYGPGQKIPFMIPDITSQLSKNKPVSLRTPMAVRDFVYVSDVANAFILSGALEFEGFLALNIGSGKGISVQNLARKLILQKRSACRIDKNNISDTARTYVVADLRNTAKILDWKPEISLSRGLFEVARSS